VPGAHQTEVVCISERSGLIVGSYQPRSGAGHRSFTYHHGVFRTLPRPIGSADVFPQCGNDRSRVVGFYYSNKNRTVAFKFTPGNTSASAISQSGQLSPAGTAPISVRTGRP
jgi:hypothetical protein